MRTNTQQTIAAILALAMAFTFNACSSDDNGDGGGGSSSLESLLANDPWYQQMKKELEYYDPYNSRERCTAAGVVERSCVPTDRDTVWYNPLRQHCEKGRVVGTYDVCGSEIYLKVPNFQKCENNVLLSRCGDEWYNTQTHSCPAEYDSSTDEYSYSIEPIDPKNLCNGVRFYYEEGYTECRDGVVKRSCGTLWYNRDTDYCDDGNKVKSAYKCSGITINRSHTRCATDGKTLEERCNYDNNAPWHNPITQACSYNDGSYTLKNKIKCSK